jgi:hypothetical protein
MLTGGQSRSASLVNILGTSGLRDKHGGTNCSYVHISCAIKRASWAHFVGSDRSGKIVRQVAIVPRTAHFYVGSATGLETVFRVHRLVAWSRNLGQRLVKAPKVHLVDSGLACHLLGTDTRSLA